MNDEAAGNIHHLRHGDQIVQWLDRKLGEHVGVDRHGADVAEQERVAVGIGSRRNLHADVAGCTRAVIDHDLFLEQFGHARLQNASDKIGGATRRERHHHAHCAGRVILRNC